MDALSFVCAVVAGLCLVIVTLVLTRSVGRFVFVGLAILPVCTVADKIRAIHAAAFEHERRHE
jgi:hypothetical protein